MKIALIHMPFAPPEGPAIGLTQLAAVVNQQFKEHVDVALHYLNLDFAAKMKTTDFYDQAISPYARLSGLSDWFFRSAAFPEEADNLEAYLARYYFDESEASTRVVDFVRNQRRVMYDLLDELIDEKGLVSADLVGFSLCFFQTVASLAMAKRLRVRNPKVRIVFGGPAVKGVLGQTLIDHALDVDYVVSGPGLVSFPALVKCCLAGEYASIPKIQGVLVRGAEGGGSAIPAEGETLDINTEVPLDYDSFLDKYNACMAGTGRTPFLLLQTSRGCWWADKQRCTFCGLNSLSECFEAMEPRAAIRHIQSVLAYAQRVSYFVACDNIIPPRYFKEVLPCLTVPKGAFIKYETRSTLTAEDLCVLCDAGIRCVQPGVEALSTESLKLMCKGTTAFNNVWFLKACLRYSLLAEWNILLFSPGESESVYQKYEQEIPDWVHLQPPGGVFPIEFVRDSRYFENPEAFGLLLEPPESFHYIYPFDQQTCAGLSYRFSDKNADHEKRDDWMERLGKVVALWQKKWDGPAASVPRLLFGEDEHSAYIHDSRFGDMQSYRICETARTVLKQVANMPMTVDELVVTSGGGKEALTQTIAYLKEKHLLFEENGRYLSLTIDEVS